MNLLFELGSTTTAPRLVGSHHERGKAPVGR